MALYDRQPLAAGPHRLAPASSSRSWRAASAPAVLSAAPRAAVSMHGAASPTRPMIRSTSGTGADRRRCDCPLWIRTEEIEQSLGADRANPGAAPAGPCSAEPATPRGGEGVALVEGFRGDILAWLALAADGTVRRAAICAIPPGSSGRCWKRRSKATSSPTSRSATSPSTALLRPRSLDWKLLCQDRFCKARCTVAAPPAAADDLAALAAATRRGCAAQTRPQPGDPRGRCRLLQWLRAGDPCAQQSLLRFRALRPALRGLAAPCRCADGDGPGDREYARGAGAHL